MAKAVTLSSITGVWFGVEAVLVNAVSAAWSHGGGIAALGRPTGLVALIGAIVVSLAGFTLGQFAFRAGNLAASFPSMLVVDPLIGVLLGVVLLHERLRSGVLVDLGYAVCAGVIVFATFRLARTTEQPAPRPAPA
jgi:threonine/homoserine efflux transporter RhtA